MKIYNLINRDHLVKQVLQDQQEKEDQKEKQDHKV